MGSRHQWFGQVVENVEITGFAAEGKALGRIEELVVFVDFGAPGDVVDILIKKTRSSFLEGEIIKIRKPSPHRVDSVCSHFGTCGGCRWQHLSYEKQLEFKQQQVVDSLERIGKVPVGAYQLFPIRGCDNPYFYRNKLEFTFSNRRWLTRKEYNTDLGEHDLNALGFHIPGLFDKVFDVQKCWLQPEPSNAIRLAVKDFSLHQGLSFFDLKKGQGLLRNLIIRNSSKGDVMVTAVFGRDDQPRIALLLDYLKRQFPEITTLAYFINTKRNSSLNDLEPMIYHGRPFMEEAMEGLRFAVGPRSFYQTNSAQAWRLYTIARHFAQLSGREVVYDLYSGTGTIALFVAPEASRVIGIDYVEEAIVHARDNALRNNIANARFFAGDMAKVFNLGFVEQHGRPDVVITDPPRAGMHPDVIKSLLHCRPSKIVYVSCNPATQARDIAMLAGDYHLQRVQAVDMFPQTHHVESVALLERKA